ncbi:glycosyltransferase [Dyadobacter sp. CY345]|uniref:glycosyltransferase family 2 protein n=1 Tax=Dyadobacter sp. CY345 TaxID=2909335 RepID=UPI001F2DA16F|nr:glycosyltransferase family 2 protein [Dyadobacter sp. CY345]MCF2447070.1 glycosyltransferase [Dyadobacter sp. CY345]
MNNLKVSIVTPSYNQGQFIEETIQSVLDQDYDNLEYLVIDGGSTDNTVEVIKKYEDRLKYWVSEKDNGQTHAINKGFAMASGDIIAWINSDDVYCKGAIQAVTDFFEKNPQANVVVGNGLFMDYKGEVYERKYPNISRFQEKHCMMSIFQPSTFLRRSILTDIGFLNEDYQMIMDAEWFYRIAAQYPFYVIDKDLSIFRWHKDSKSSGDHNSKLFKRYMHEHLTVVKRAHPGMAGLISTFPKASFKAHIYAGFAVRFLRRLYKRELYKMKDTNV